MPRSQTLFATVVIGFEGSERCVLVDSSRIHPGPGANLPSASGDRIELSVDGSRLLLGRAASVRC